MADDNLKHLNPFPKNAVPGKTIKGSSQIAQEIGEKRKKALDSDPKRIAKQKEWARRTDVADTEDKRGVDPFSDNSESMRMANETLRDPNSGGSYERSYAQRRSLNADEYRAQALRARQQGERDKAKSDDAIRSVISPSNVISRGADKERGENPMRPIASFKCGGTARKSGPYRLHAGERAKKSGRGGSRC